MPTGFKHSLGKPQDLNECPFPESREEDDQVARHVNAFMRNLEVYKSDIDVHLVGPGTFRGERRHLEHGSKTDLYYEYLAHCNSDGKEAASFTTFARVADKIIGPHLRSGHLHFRKPNEHSKCDVCASLKNAIRKKAKKAADKQAHDEAVRNYSMHILAQWLDRQIYWSFRTLSQTWCKQELLLGERCLAVI